MNTIKLFLYYILFIVVLCTACGGDPFLEIKPSEPVNVFNEQINAVDVYIDCSGSMKGYVVFENKDAEIANQAFKYIVPLFINNVINQIGEISIYRDINGVIDAVIKDGQPRVTVFFNHLISGDFFSGSATELDGMISRIVERTKEDSTRLSVLITDAILSFGPAKLRNDRMYNINNKAILKSNIHNALLCDTSLSISIVKYLSDFNGKYYWNCKEDNREFQGKLMNNRPFYLFLIGKKELVSALLSTENLLPPSEGVFTVTNPVELEVALFKKKLEQGKGKLNSIVNVTDRRGVISATTSYERNKDKVFIIGIKKSNVPRAYYRDERDFFSNLKCDNKNVIIEKLGDVNGIDGIDEKVSNPNRVQNYDYFYKITLNKEMFAGNLQNKELEFYFEPSLDVKESHTDKDYDLDDRHDTLYHKTWGFNLITEAVKAAHPNKQPQGARFTLTLNRIIK